MYRRPDGSQAVPAMDWSSALQANPYLLLPPAWNGAPYHLQPPMLATSQAAPWTGAYLQGSTATQPAAGPPSQQQQHPQQQHEPVQQPHFAVGPGVASAAPQAGTTPIATGDVSQTAVVAKWGGKVELAQRWLLFMRHCATCKASNGQCEHGSRCRSGRSLWDHMINCQSADCRYPKCHQVKAILKHHKKCTSVTCRVCMPVKRYVNRTAPVNPNNAVATKAAAAAAGSHQAGALTARMDGAQMGTGLKQ